MEDGHDSEGLPYIIAVRSILKLDLIHFILAVEPQCILIK